MRPAPAVGKQLMQAALARSYQPATDTLNGPSILAPAQTQTISAQICLEPEQPSRNIIFQPASSPPSDPLNAGEILAGMLAVGAGAAILSSGSTNASSSSTKQSLGTDDDHPAQKSCWVDASHAVPDSSPSGSHWETSGHNGVRAPTAMVHRSRPRIATRIPTVPAHGNPPTGGSGFGTSSSWQTACNKQFAAAEVACTKSPNEAACMKQAIAADKTCSLAASNNAQQHRNHLPPDPSRTPQAKIVRVNCRVVHLRNVRYCSFTASSLRDACMSKAVVADHLCAASSSR